MNITVPGASITAMCVTVALCILLPILLYVLIARREKRLLTALLFGALGFFISQILIRLPLVGWLGTQAWFQTFASAQTVLYCLVMAASAALFETAGRLFVFRVCLKNRLSYCTAFSAGVGHGGIEAIALIGVTYLNYILYSVQANQGALILTDGGTVTEVLAALAATPTSTFYLAGVERACTIALHMALSVLLCFYIMKNRTWLGALICFLIHMCVDFIAGLLSVLGADILAVEGVVFLVAVLSVWYLIAVKKRYPASQNRDAVTAPETDEAPADAAG